MKKTKKRIFWAALGITELFFIMLLLFSWQRETVILTLIYQLNLVIMRKAHLIHNKAFPGAILLRRAVYFLPHTIALLTIASRIPGVWSGLPISLFFAAAVLSGIGVVALRLPQWRPYFNADFVHLLPPVTLSQIGLDTASAAASAVFQELFYKLCVFTLIYSVFGPLAALLISSYLFVMEHLLHYIADEMFEPVDYLIQFGVSISGGLLFIASGSVWPAVIMHGIYNLPGVVNLIFRFRIGGVNVETSMGNGKT